MRHQDIKKAAIREGVRDRKKVVPTSDSDPDESPEPCLEQQACKSNPLLADKTGAHVLSIGMQMLLCLVAKA